jgi:uncharacterized protein YndB with AHSA1/START domain
LRRDLKFEVTYPHAIAQWLMKNDFEVRVGHKFQFKAEPRPGWDGVVNCEVLEADPPRRLVYTWCGGNINTTVSWDLEPVAEGTRLRLEHRGFRGLRGWMISRMLGKGWRTKILAQDIPALLERQGSRSRRS